MDHNDSARKIAALTAIVQTMMPELYWDARDNAAQPFDNAVRDDDPLALAISETLTPEEIAHAFAWADASQRSPHDDLAAIPVVPYLGAELQVRVRVMLVAHDAADDAHTVAVGPREAPRRDAGRALAIATRRFVEAMTRDALAHRGGGGEHAPGATIDERTAALPEPWRTRTLEELERLKVRIENTVERDRAGPGER